MNILINNSSMQPIYEQIVEQIKISIMREELSAGELLPSVRSLAADLRISALTVKKAYDALEQEGFIVTVHGKGSFVSNLNQGLRKEEQRKEIERIMDEAISRGRRYGLSEEELRQLFEICMEL